MAKPTKKELVCIRCPKCHREICGTSLIQAKAMLKEHYRSNIHKERLEAMNMSGSHIVKIKEGVETDIH